MHPGSRKSTIDGKTTIVMAVALIAICLLIGTALAKKPTQDPPPCDGAPIEVYVESHCGKSMWIQINDSTTVCNILCMWNKTKKDNWTCPVLHSWIGGIVVADPSYEHGFYFDPNTVIVAEVTAEGLQTTICFIANTPSFFDGGYWYVQSEITDVREL